MRLLSASLVLLLAATGCDTTPGPAPLGQRPPVLEDFSLYPQKVIYALLPADQVDGDSVRIPVTMGVTARGQGAGVSEVRYVVQSPTLPSKPLLTGLLTRAGQSHYEKTITLNVSALEVRSYSVLVYAVDDAERISGDMRGMVHYFREFAPSEPPSIESLVVPDTLYRPAAGSPAVSLLLVAEASDPDGLSDVAIVEFWNENVPATRLLMCDDGGAATCGASPDSGDDVAGDGFFTRRVFITSDNSPGTNTLLFQATDRAGLVSSTVSHDIVIL